MTRSLSISAVLSIKSFKPHAQTRLHLAGSFQPLLPSLASRQAFPWNRMIPHCKVHNVETSEAAGSPWQPRQRQTVLGGPKKWPLETDKSSRPTAWPAAKHGGLCFGFRPHRCLPPPSCLLPNETQDCVRAGAAGATQSRLGRKRCTGDLTTTTVQ